MISPYQGKFKVTQVYKGIVHKGIDLVGLDTKNITSTVIGVVEAVRKDTHPTGGMGLYVRVREFTTGYRHYFAHLRFAYTKEGQLVSVGDLIGVEGNSGHSFGNHLHYEIRKTTNNMSFLNVSELTGIPNRLGVYEVTDDEKAKDVDVTIGNTVVKSKLINGITYSPLRETIDAIKSELDVVWDKNKGAGVKF